MSKMLPSVVWPSRPISDNIFHFFSVTRILIISDKKLIQLCDSCHINNGNRKEMENII
jgi:hypothetical protein